MPLLPYSPHIFLPTPSARRATSGKSQKISACSISTHALREEGDLGRQVRCCPCRRFLPTPSARRATTGHMELDGTFIISTHALREEGDPAGFVPQESHNNFYPRPPRGGRLAGLLRPGRGRIISTHALREEGDLSSSSQISAPRNFYPRPPRGGRRAAPCPIMRSYQFLPTPSARRATRGLSFFGDSNSISTHALREEGDSKCAIK